MNDNDYQPIYDCGYSDGATAATVIILITAVATLVVLSLILGGLTP